MLSVQEWAVTDQALAAAYLIHFYGLKVEGNHPTVLQLYQPPVVVEVGVLAMVSTCPFQSHGIFS